jgi:hypothetical protein
VTLAIITSAIILIQVLIGVWAKQPSPQMLGLADVSGQQARSGKTGFWESIHVALSIFIFLPLLALLAGLSLPYVAVAGYIMRRRERAFLVKMSLRNRVLDWVEFQQAVDDMRGTLIVEQYSMKGPWRRWWTPENVYEQCPLAIANSLMVSQYDESFRPLAEWIRRKYTSEECGCAFLVDDGNFTRDQNKVLTDALKSGAPSIRWLEVAPPESLCSKRKR